MIRIIQLGIGALGKQVLQYATDREGVDITGVVDLNPDLQGKRISTLFDGIESDVQVSADVAEAINTLKKPPEVAVITTVSSIEKLVSQVQQAAEAGLHIVTTCEEMIFPWRQHPKEAEMIDNICRDAGVACVGTGVNPGFLMDFLPAAITSVSQRVDHILVERVQDASHRRVPFQKKIGAGLTHTEFDEKQKNGSLRHVGLPESVDLIAAAMGWELDQNSETLNPVLAALDLNSGYMPIKKGMPSGVEQIGIGLVNGNERIKLVFRAAVGEGRSYDKITVKGLPGITTEIEGGVNGDIATCAITINAVRSITACSPGLKTMLDIPVPAWFSDLKTK